MVLGRNQNGHAHQVHLWAFEKEVAESVRATRENQLFLPRCKLPDSVTASTDLARALSRAEMVVSVMPSHPCRRVFTSMAPYLKSEMVFVSATESLENASLLRI